MIFLDVGQGDCALIRTAEGDILIDAGPELSQPTLCLRLEELGVKRIRLAIFTHADEDHVGGADGVIERFPTQEIWFNGDGSESDSARRLMDKVDPSVTTLQSVGAGSSRVIGELVLSVLYPFAADGVSENESSIVTKVHFREIDLLFTGDVGAKEEAALVSRYGATQLDCDLYKVGHHGSNTSSSEVFLDAMKPQFAVICCGADNSYGHPMGEVLARLEAAGATVVRTDRSGELIFESDGVTLTCRE